MAAEIGVGIVGTGFMGAAHAMAFRTAPFVFETELRPRLEMIADITLDRLKPPLCVTRSAAPPATGASLSPIRR